MWGEGGNDGKRDSRNDNRVGTGLKTPPPHHEELMKKLRDLGGELAHILGMNIKRHIRIGIIAMALAGLLSACASIKIPDIDFIKLPEFQSDAENVGAYPDVADAPAFPENVKNDASWDEVAKRIIIKRDAFVTPPDEEAPKTAAQIEQERQQLIAKINEYKLDDPQ